MYAKNVLALTIKHLEAISPILTKENMNKMTINDFFKELSESEVTR